jgi:SAM-dependent methyltransferase
MNNKLQISRACAVCHSSEQSPLHRQYFVFPEEEQPQHYDVVACQQCGFIFAANLPSEQALNAYYAASGHHLHVDLPAGIQVIHQDMYQFIRKHTPLNAEQAVLDIGSSMGHFLNWFRRDGFSDLTGVEPSREAAKLARQHYDIAVESTTLDAFKPSRDFDLVSLCGVLEHLHQPDAVLAKVANLLTAEGHVFVAVPDADAFGNMATEEPFLEFALEHINFFGRDSLIRLFENTGFEVLVCDSVHNDFYNNFYLYLVARRSDSPKASIRPASSASRDSVISYIAHSQSLLNDIEKRLSLLVERDTPLIVWGAGSLTRRLCATTSVGRTRLLGFVDKNRDLHGQQLLGKTIHAPDWLDDKGDQTVLIASTTYADEIRQELQQQFQWQGEILTIEQAQQ